ncbi:MAG TPA: hypothetical protein VJ817_03765 [Gemmatimonadales bacterium]|nr:hypothetical protein [Gemmatimonadales bacterium]
MGQPVTPAAAAPRPAIISPLIDALCVGGLSLLLLLPLLLSGRADLVIVGVGMQAWIAALVNMPHFMASYRLVYRNRETINAHRWAAIYVPLILIAYIAFAVWQSRETDLYVSILMTVQGAYLAWHYTGQAWGMMATYTYLDGRSFQQVERRLVRGGLYLLLAWHVAWFFRWGFGETRFGPLLESLYFILSVLSAVALGAGLVGLAMMKARTGRFPPARALIAWGAIFVWYAAMARDPRAIFWVQIAHALQYLMFPVRVEINRTRRSGSGPGRLVTHMAAYLIVLLAVSVAMAVWIPARAMDVVADWLGRRPGEVTALSLLAFLNVHHYFTDGVMWKLRNPAVRADLFGHLPAPDKAAPAPPPPSPTKSRRARRERRAG